ncbi:hypothetical protein SLE2022_267910 [Rubroshorea leprosula]
MVKLVQGTEAEASSHQPKRRGRKAKFTPDERRARKRACDNKRYHRTQATLRQIKFLKTTNANLAFENRRLKSRIAALARVVRATNANLKLVKDRLMNMDNRIEKFLRGELEENDLMSLEIPLDNVYLGGEENRLMILGPSNHISNEVPGMSNQETMAKLQKMRDSYEESKRENVKRLEELEKENEKLKSRVTAIETDKSKDAKK